MIKSDRSRLLQTGSPGRHRVRVRSVKGGFAAVCLPWRSFSLIPSRADALVHPTPTRVTASSARSSASSSRCSLYSNLSSGLWLLLCGEWLCAAWNRSLWVRQLSLWLCLWLWRLLSFEGSVAVVLPVYLLVRGEVHRHRFVIDLSNEGRRTRVYVQPQYQFHTGQFPIRCSKFCAYSGIQLNFSFIY